MNVGLFAINENGLVKWEVNVGKVKLYYRNDEIGER